MTDQSQGCREYRRLARVSRRNVLQAGVLGGLGLTLPGFLRLQAAQADLARGGQVRPAKVKSVIMLWLQGGVSHHDTFDMKPQAPSEIRGELFPIKTNVAGVQICELMPLLAQRMDKLAVVRSATHGEAAHERGMRYVLAGRRPQPGSPPPRKYPDMGAVVAYELGMRRGVPPYVVVPGSDFTAGIHHYNNGYLPPITRPFYAKDAGVFALPDNMSNQRFRDRMALKAQVEAAAHSGTAELDELRAWDRFNEQAAQIVAEARARKAFDISDEPDETKALYGIATGGSGGKKRRGRVGLGEYCLTARRLVEAGVRFVTIGRDSWDHHSNIFPQLKSRVPRFDHAFAGLLDDLGQRGMLESTMVVYLTEFGRTPKVNSGGGRDHWPGVFSVAFAGAGIKTGQIIGASDKQGGHPIERPVSPEEIAATIYHLVGIDPYRVVITPQGQSVRYVDNAQPVRELLA